MSQRATLTVVSGPNSGDTVSIEKGTCRLVGRHLSESETAMIDRDGNRIIDASSCQIISEHLNEKAPNMGATAQPAPDFNADVFDRGPDVILSDDSISRAHAMLFFEDTGFGIIDLASTNGSIINTEKVTSALANDGDTIILGGTEFEVSIPS